MASPRPSDEAAPRTDSSLDFQSVPCPICGNGDLEPISNKGQFGLPCHVSICPSDGLVLLSPRWSKNRYLRFYQTEYDTYYRPDVAARQTDDAKYRKIQEICSRLEAARLIEGRQSVLDVGAGMGWSLDWLQKTYPSIQKLAAVESSQHCITNLESVIGAEVLSNDIDAEWTSSGFDLVIMRHVLEHFMNPIDALKKVRANLAPGGVAYIAVPDMMNPSGSLTHYWFRSVHTYYFSRETLATVASMASLRPIELRSENSELWGVFAKADETEGPAPSRNGVYERQLEVIEAHRKRTRLLDIKFRIKRAIKRLLGPAGVRRPT